ncbi:TPA: ABC transporter ATP-binding protein [Streptococcus pneumoniae]
MIKFDNIQIKYGDFVAIDNLNLDIHEGEFFTFLGPSGCGKSTTLRALVGFLDPSSGSIEVNGTDVTHLEPEKRGIGIVFQSYALFPTMTVFDNIAFGLKVKQEVLKLMEQMSLIWNLKSVELVLYFNLMRYFQL